MLPQTSVFKIKRTVQKVNFLLVLFTVNPIPVYGNCLNTPSTTSLCDTSTILFVIIPKASLRNIFKSKSSILTQ